MSLAFIVDGPTEKKIVQALCPGAPVRMTLLNGRDVSIEAIAKTVATLFRLYKGRHFPVLVIADRETRDISSQALEQAILAALRQHDIPQDQLIISCPDRMIENWMLADGSALEQEFGCAVEECNEGANGKAEIRRLLRSRGLQYHEIAIGVEIFKKICPFQAAARSSSFARFADRAKVYCPWLRRRRRRRV